MTSVLPAAQIHDIETMFDDLVCYMRVNGPMMASDLSEYEDRVWRTRYRAEKRSEANQQMMFTTTRVQFFVCRRRNDIAVGYCLEGQPPTAPTGWSVSQAPRWSPGSVPEVYRGITDARPVAAASEANGREDARLAAWEDKRGRKARRAVLPA